MKTILYYTEVDTPLGPLLIVGTKEAVIRIDFGTWEQRKEGHEKWFPKYFKRIMFTPVADMFAHVKEQLFEYFAKERQQFTFSFELYGTPFQKRAWQALSKTTPFGQTKSYQELAEAIDHPKAVRAIGGAMNRNPLSIVIPCHRVLGKNKQLTGYGGGLDKKEFLLRHEGISYG